MLKTINLWFQEKLSQTEKNDDLHTVELATAVLLYEIMRADDTFLQSEHDEFEKLLTTQFNLDKDELEVLLDTSKHHAKTAVDFQQFTRVLNEKCDVEQKHQVLESLWRVAYADKHLDVHEIHLIRRISDLLHIPHSEFIKSKIKVTESNG